MDSLLNLSPDPVIIRLIIERKSGRILDASEGAAMFYGWSRETLRRMHIQDINTLSAEQIRLKMDEAASGDCHGCEFHHKTADGTIRSVEVFISKILFAGKEAFSSVVHDITERSQIESALRRSEARCRELLENTQEAVYKRNLQKNVFDYVSPAFSVFSGYPHKVILGWSDDDVINLVHPFDRERIKRLKLSPLSASNACGYQVEYRFKHACGHYIHLLDRFKIMADENGASFSRIGTVSDISERKQTEDIIQEKSRRLESIVQATEIGTWEWNIQTGDLEVNDYWAAMLGYTVAELKPLSVKTWKQYTHPDDQRRSIELLEKHIVGELPNYENEFRVRHKAGHWIWVLSSGRIIRRLHDGDPVIMYGIHIDITERRRIEESLIHANEHLEQVVQKRTTELIRANFVLRDEMEKRRKIERSLRENEERYRRITEGISDCIYTVHLQAGEAVSVSRNTACAKVTGYALEEYTADPELWIRIAMTEDRHLIIDNFKLLLATNQPATAEYRIQRKDKRIIWVSDTIIPQFDAAGELVAYDGVVIDITTRKMAELQLSHSRATLAMAIDGMPDPLILFDYQLRVLRLNKAAKEYYGIDHYETAIGKRCFEAFKGRTSPCETCEYPFSTMRGYSGVFERKGGMDQDRLEQIVVDEVKNSNGIPNAYIVRIFDITEERKMARQLIQREKLASLGLLVAGVAHEINNPNNFIFFNIPILRSYLQFLLPIVDQYADTRPDLLVFNRPYPDFRQDCFTLLDNIEHGSKRINQIVGNLREFVRERGQGKKQHIDAKWVVEKAVNICQGRIKKSVRHFTTDLAEGLPSLLSDPLALEQIVVNLLINAVQSMDKEDSQIHIKLSMHDSLPGELVIEVRDNGCGMDHLTRLRIFDPFYTKKPAGDGTGLGLTICDQLINELGGRIEVSSELGKGSTFQVLMKTQ
ncbi:MAG: PAS domain S-box protein [Desulfobulbus sp.]|nr:PAS domain S-box protein [Desulfobulbus sp.]